MRLQLKPSGFLEPFDFPMGHFQNFLSLDLGALQNSGSLLFGFFNCLRPKSAYLIVKACHRAETPLEPTNQGKVYNDEKPMPLEERKAALVALGCIDVPVPMDFLADALSPSSCMGHGGYLAAMQFLEQRQDLAEFPAVGSWECIITDHEVIGAESM